MNLADVCLWVEKKNQKPVRPVSFLEFTFAPAFKSLSTIANTSPVLIFAETGKQTFNLCFYDSYKCVIQTGHPNGFYKWRITNIVF